MNKNYFHFLCAFLLIFVFLTPAQTVDFDGHSISIGDSLEQVINKFNPAGYSMSCDTLESTSITYRVYKLSGESDPETGATTRTRTCIGYLYFTYSADKQDEPKKLFQVGRVLSDWEHSESLSLIEAVFSVLAKVEPDSYYKDFSFSSQHSGSYSTKRFILKLRPNISLEIYVGNRNYYQVTEYITRDEHKGDKEIYIAIFDDSQHLIDKNNEILTMKFSSKAEAESGINRWQIQYITQGYNLPYSKIIKFWDTKLGMFNGK